MKYEVITDLQGYVQVLRHTGTRRDFVELDLDKYDLSEDRMYAYKLGRNELIFDEKRYQEILDAKQHKADLKEIADLKEKLNGTDWIMAKWVEEILSLNNPLTWVADVIKINIKYMKEYAVTIEERKAWRKRIEELENG